MAPIVSVLVGTYNRPHLLRGLLASLQAQTLTNWECLVMDEGYAEHHEAAHIITQFGDPRITHYPCGPFRNDWHAEAKNLGAAMASGRWFVFPADDAYYVPTAFAVMTATAEARGWSLVYCDWLYNQMGYVPWRVLSRVGHIDVGGFLVRRATWLDHPWTQRSQTADGEWIEQLVLAGVPHGSAPGVCYVKN